MGNQVEYFLFGSTQEVRKAGVWASLQGGLRRVRAEFRGLLGISLGVCLGGASFQNQVPQGVSCLMDMRFG